MAKSFKGAAFERSCCRQLSLWWSAGRSDCVFWRTSGSGGRAALRSRQGKDTLNHYGDVMAVDPQGSPLLDVLTIEIKCGYSKYTIADLLDKPEHAAQQQYEKWFAQAIAGQEQSGSAYWILIVKRNKRVAFLCMPRALSDDLYAVGCRAVAGRIWLAPLLTLEFVMNGRNLLEVSCIPLTDFLAIVRPEDIRDLASRC